MRRWTVAGIALLLLLSVAAAVPVAADDGWRFRLTTPRGSLERGDGLTLRLGVPSGRAWGVESTLRSISGPRELTLTIAVRDVTVREAFVRVAWYDRDTGRPRQTAIADSNVVRAGEQDAVVVTLDPPDGAIAYRLRVLARLEQGAARSSDGAILATSRSAVRDAPEYTRLMAEGP
jgi:hypothetical protein